MGQVLVVSVLNEFPFTGGIPPVATTNTVEYKVLSEGKAMLQEEGKAPRLASKNENSKVRTNHGAATSSAEEREIFQLFLLADFGWHQWEEINHTAMPKLFCLVCSGTVA